jgi:hypothetical protein
MSGKDMDLIGDDVGEIVQLQGTLMGDRRVGGRGGMRNHPATKWRGTGAGSGLSVRSQGGSELGVRARVRIQSFRCSGTSVLKLRGAWDGTHARVGAEQRHSSCAASTTVMGAACDGRTSRRVAAANPSPDQDRLAVVGHVCAVVDLDQRAVQAGVAQPHDAVEARARDFGFADGDDAQLGVFEQADVQEREAAGAVGELGVADVLEAKGLACKTISRVDAPVPDSVPSRKNGSPNTTGLGTPAICTDSGILGVSRNGSGRGRWRRGLR